MAISKKPIHSKVDLLLDEFVIQIAINFSYFDVEKTSGRGLLAEVSQPMTKSDKIN